MLRIDQLRLHPGQQETLLRTRCAKLLRVAPADITACTVLRKAAAAISAYLSTNRKCTSYRRR